MAQDELKISTEILRKTVPLLMQYKVAATPKNYALWYTYVEQSNPPLNSSMNEIIKSQGHCTPSVNEQLYKEHLADKHETNLGELKQNLELMVGELSSTMDSTLSDSSEFSNMIDKSFGELERIESDGLSIEEVMQVVGRLVEDSKYVRHSTNFLNNQLKNASEEITRLKKKLAEVQKDVLFDALSDLYNRRAFDKDIQMLCSSNESFSLVLLDLDHFKKLNDNYSHLLGDAVIRAVANRLKSACRDGISAYRYGGEEFALIIPNKNLRSACHLAETSRRSIEKIIVRDKQSGESVSSITASFGVAESKDNEEPMAMVARADKLLYEAKQLGRNRVMPIN